MRVIETHDLTKTYRKHFSSRAVPSLEALDLGIEDNEVFGFLGKNGAGKTTTIKILCGLIRPTRGRASIQGIDVRNPAARRMLGYLPDNPYYYEYLTPRETLNFYGQLESMSRAERRREWDKLSEMLDLRDIANQRVRDFSKGMRQRLGFAVALVGDPKILILDEPMSGLDPAGRRLIRDLILHMRELKKTIFFSSHVLGDVEQICDRVAILAEGRLSVQGRIDELLTRRVNQVEVIVQDVPAFLLEELATQAIKQRDSEDGLHFYFHDIDSANAAVRRITESGARLIEFTPVRESLEDYFLREETQNYFTQKTPKEEGSLT